jgi:hypothetical protein
MSSLESTSILPVPKTVDSLEPLGVRSQPTLTGSQWASSEAFGLLTADLSESGAAPSAHQGRHVPAVEAIAQRLRRAFAQSARAWALAAGVPPGLTSESLAALVEGRAELGDH